MNPLLTRNQSPDPQHPALPPLQVFLAAPRGFCAGVRRAIDAVEEALRHFGPPVYVRRAIVHNLAVVRSLEAKGAIFVQELDDVPRGAVAILSAHGVARHILAQGERLGQRLFNAICPLVAKVHNEVVRHHQDGRHVILVGHDGHPETIGTLGQLPPGCASVVGTPAAVEALDIDPSDPVAYAVQTTYSTDEAAGIAAAIHRRFADVRGPNGTDICYATTNRQAAVKSLAPRVDAVIVAGEDFSSNACRLAEVARAFGCPSVQLVADASHVDWSLLQRSRTVAITAAASTPEDIVSEIVAALARRFDLSIEEVEHVTEEVSFKPLKVH